jgi:protein phosphatase 1 regulatory subunit 14B
MDRKKLSAEPTAALSVASKEAVRVGFSLQQDKHGKVENDRKKYLTAKYGQHQMALIKKRLNVELWLIEELQILYPKDGVSGISALECDIDLDDLLDLERDDERRRFLKLKLADCPQSTHIVARFIEDLLLKAKSL